MRADTAEAPYAAARHDVVRQELETAWFARLVPGLLRASGGGAVLDLGCGDGLVRRLAGPGLTRYAGVDLSRREEPGFIAHDLRHGLGPVGRAPFDLYLGTFGIASHVSPDELGRLLREIARHARPGSLVAVEALGLRSLEWPRLWDTPPGPQRTLPYRLGSDVPVHPWAPAELAARYESAGIRPLWALDRSVQAGPKAGDGRYWPGLPRLRAALNALLAGDAAKGAVAELTAPLPPLPADSAALVHQALAARRRALLGRGARDPRALARAVWELEPTSGGGWGHGLLVVGRVA
jgi:SAM-dependent methyltransferase